LRMLVNGNPLSRIRPILGDSFARKSSAPAAHGVDWNRPMSCRSRRHIR
jgi:hypothetical protein